MKCRSFKLIRTDLESLAPIKNKEALLAALPIIVEGAEKIKAMRKTIKKISDMIADLVDAASDYATNHVSSVFVNGLVTDGDGVKHGDVNVDGTIYHFAGGFGKLIRIDGDNITQTFIGTLPDEWKKDKVEIDLTAINRLGVTTEQLQAAGLVRSANNVWSLPATSDESE